MKVTNELGKPVAASTKAAYYITRAITTWHVWRSGARSKHAWVIAEVNCDAPHGKQAAIALAEWFATHETFALKGGAK